MRPLLAALLLFTACKSQFRTLSLNIANGAGYNSQEVRQKQAAFLAKHPAEVIALQEVDMGATRSGGGNTALEVLPEGGTLLYVECDEWDLTYDNGSAGAGAAGHAMWLAPGIEVTRRTNIVFPSDGTDSHRSAILASLRLPDGRESIVLSTHLTAYGPYPGYSRGQQLRAIADLAPVAPSIVMGDMNTTQNVVGSILTKMSPLTPEAIDQVWAITGYKATGTLLATEGVSDHEWAAYAEFE